MALMPYTEKTENASISYKMHLETPKDSIKVRLFFDSTLPFKKGGHHVSAFFEGATEKSININVDLNWENNYSKMYPAGAARIIQTEMTLPLNKSEDGTYILRMKPLDPGVVIYKVIIDAGGYERTRLNMNESPYTRE